MGCDKGSLKRMRRGWAARNVLASQLRCASQAETFAKPVTDGASAACRHFEKSVMLCLISNLATSRRCSILGFRLLLGVLQRFQPETVKGRLKTLKYRFQAALTLQRVRSKATHYTMPAAFALSDKTRRSSNAQV